MSLVVGTQDAQVVGPTGGRSVVEPNPSGAGGFLSSGADRVVGQRSSLGLTSEDASSDSSSIGVPEGDSDDEEEVQSTLSVGALEDCLPMKKGLSNFYAGRSKSFGNLADVRSVNQIAKEENPVNKRRRNLVAYKLSWSSLCSSPTKRRAMMMMMMQGKDRSLFYGHGNPTSMPLLPVEEDDDDDDDDDDQGADYISRGEEMDKKIGMP